MQRAVVLGTSGAGKTAVAAALSRSHGIRHIDLDHLARGPSWSRVPDTEFRGRVAAVVAEREWIIDGDYERKLGDSCATATECPGMSISYAGSSGRSAPIFGVFSGCRGDSLNTLI